MRPWQVQRLGQAGEALQSEDRTSPLPQGSRERRWAALGALGSALGKRGACTGRRAGLVAYPYPGSMNFGV